MGFLIFEHKPIPDISIKCIVQSTINNRTSLLIVGGYVTVAEMISFNGRHGLVVSYSTATATNLKLEALFPSNLDARQGQVVYDTKRNQLYFIAQLPNRAINKKGETVPTLAYTLAVMKRNATGSLLGTSSVNMMGGETNLLHSSISAFYDDVRDRLVARYFIAAGSNSHPLLCGF